MTIRDAIEAKRMEAMKPYLRFGFTAEPCISIPLEYVKIDRDRQTAYVTLADLSQCFVGDEH